MWIAMVGCLTQAPEEAIVTAAELDAAVQAALDAKTGAPSDEAIEAYLQGPEGQALLDAKIAAYLSGQNYVTASQLEAGLDSCVLDAELPVTLDDYVPQADFDEATAETDTRLADLETDAANSVLLANTDIAVADCDTLIDELAALQTVRFAAGITVTLTVAPGEHLCKGAIEITHPQGSQIHIIGDVVDPTQVKLETSGGFFALGGHSLGLVDGFWLFGPPVSGVGIQTDLNGSIHVGAHMLIENFYYGVWAYDGGVIIHDGDATEHVTIIGSVEPLRADTGGVIEADYVEVDVVGACNAALFATNGAFIRAGSSTLNVTCRGAYAEGMAAVVAYNSSLVTPYPLGAIFAGTGGYIDWRDGDSASAGNDFVATHGGLVHAVGATGLAIFSEPDPYGLPSGIFQ